MKERFKTICVIFLLLRRTNEKGEEEVLLQKRKNTGYMDGKFDLACSGHTEKDETLMETVIREAKEEIGIIIEKEDLRLMTFTHEYDRNYAKFFFEAIKYNETPKIMEPHKCDELKWFPINKLPENTIPAVKYAIYKMQNKILYSEEAEEI